MATLITRLYADKATATEVTDALLAQGFPDWTMRTIEGDAGTARMAMDDAGLDPSAANAYAERMQEGGALVAVDAPFGTVGQATRTLDRYDAVEVDTTQEVYRSPATDPDYASSIIPGNKKFLTSRSEIGHSTVTGERSNMLSDRQRGKAKVGHSTKTGKRENLLSRRQKGRAKVSHKTVTGKRWNLVKKPRPGKSVVRTPTPFSDLFGWPTIIRDY